MGPHSSEVLLLFGCVHCGFEESLEKLGAAWPCLSLWPLWIWCCLCRLKALSRATPLCWVIWSHSECIVYKLRHSWFWKTKISDPAGFWAMYLVMKQQHMVRHTFIYLLPAAKRLPLKWWGGHAEAWPVVAAETEVLTWQENYVEVCSSQGCVTRLSGLHNAWDNIRFVAVFFQTLKYLHIYEVS